MYIFELITSIFKKNKKPRNYTPYSENEDLIEDSETCEHFFMPLDSSNEYFACKNCGLVVPKDKLN